MIDFLFFVSYTWFYERMNSMLTPERQQFIIEMIKRMGIVKLRDIVEATNTSESTIRRDLVELESLNLLKRVHGGAASINSKATELSMTEKTSKNVQSKKLIAGLAVTQINEGDCIYLDAGSTTFEMIPLLKGLDVTVVTNGLMHVEALFENEVTAYLIGGKMKGHTKALIGSMASESLKNYRFDKCFIGANGIHPQFGYTTPDPEEAFVKKTAISISEKVFIIADYSKFGETSFAKIGEIEEAIILTDEIDDVLAKQFEEKTSLIKVVKS